MKFSSKWILAVLVAVVGLSCESTDQKQEAVLRQTRQQALGTVQEIQYRRSGGATSNRETLSIMPDGQASAESTLFGDGRKTLSEFQMLQLSQWFENFGKWNSEYPGKSSDAIAEIQYGASTIRLYESAKDVPEELWNVQNHLRELVRQVAGQ